MPDVFYNKTITIWTRSIDGVWESENWTPHLVKNVRILVSKGYNIDKSGLRDANSCRVHIMDGVSDGLDFIPKADDYSFFTIGDSSGETPTESDFFETLKTKYDAYRIDAVDRFELIPHYEIWGR